MDSLKELREWFLEDREELAGEFWDELLQSFSAGDIPEA